MGLLDKLKGVQRPDDGVATVAASTLIETLLARNSANSPWVISQVSDTDLVADWRLADETWRQAAGQAGFTAAYRLTMRLHADDATVRAHPQTFEANWSTGGGQVSIGRRHERNGVLVKAHITVRVPGHEPLSFDFDTDELRDVLRDTVTANGWTWQPVRGAGGL